MTWIGRSVGLGLSAAQRVGIGLPELAAPAADDPALEHELLDLAERQREVVGGHRQWTRSHGRSFSG
jgi:hypothetical protein